MALEIVDILGNLTLQATQFLPNIVGAIILLVVGLVIGKIVGRLAREVLERIRLDYYISETEKPAIKLSEIFALITRWWIYLAFITAALSREVLGITSLSLWISEINTFIPRIIGAAAIIIVGYVIAEYIKNHLKSTKSLYAIITGKIFFFFVLYVAIALALPILGVPATLVNNILLVIIGSLGIGVAIAMGLGLKDAVSDISKRYVKKLRV